MTIAITVVLLLLAVASPSVAFDLRSQAFSPNAPIPRTHSCDGPDRSPPLRWTDPPTGAKSYALVVEDPDAPSGTWVHWVLFGIQIGRASCRERVERRGGAASV